MAPTTHFKENAMRFGQVCIASFALVASFGCRENPLIPDANIKPEANAGPDQLVEHAGAPVAVTLNGSASIDDDGTIRTYRWLSATAVADGGAGSRMVPEGQPVNWPDDVMNPTVMLDQGMWQFTLWVIDDKGATSEPDTVEIGVGSDPVAECVEGVVPVVAAACSMCMCAIESCQATVVETACDESCWTLIQCIGANCPDFTAMAAAGDVSCLTTNCLAQYQASQAGMTPMGATPAGACARMCPGDCSSTAMMP